MSDYNFSTPIQIRMSDLDSFGHVNNGVQCNYFDVGRGMFFEHALQRPVDWLTLDLVLVHVELDFLDSITMDDQIVCQCKVDGFGTKSMKMTQQLIDLKTQKVKTVSHCVICGFDRLTHKSIPIREEYKEKFKF